MKPESLGQPYLRGNLALSLSLQERLRGVVKELVIQHGFLEVAAKQHADIVSAETRLSTVIDDLNVFLRGENHAG